MPLQDILARHIDLGKLIYYHEILVKGSDFEVCKRKVFHRGKNLILKTG